MKPSYVCRLFFLFSSAISQVADCQSEAKPHEVRLRIVEGLGLAKLNAVSVEKSGLYVCVIPSGDGQELGDLKIYDPTGTVQAAKLIYWDKSNGLVLLESNEPQSEIHLPISSQMGFEPGRVLTMQVPSGSVRVRLAGWDRHYLGKELPSPMLRFRMDSDVDCAPGAPLVNEVGELEGLVVSSNLTEPNGGHAIPAGMIRKVIRDVLSHQKSGPVWVGMVFQSDSSTPQVVEVKKDSPAEKSGIKPHDVILEVDGTQIFELDDLVEALKFLPGERSSRLKVLRDLDVKEIDIIPMFVEEIHSF